MKPPSIWTSHPNQHLDRALGIAHVKMAILKWTCVSISGQENGYRSPQKSTKHNAKTCLPPCCWEAANCWKAAYSWEAMYGEAKSPAYWEFVQLPLQSGAKWTEPGLTCLVKRGPRGNTVASLQFFQKGHHVNWRSSEWREFWNIHSGHSRTVCPLCNKRFESLPQYQINIFGKPICTDFWGLSF